MFERGNVVDTPLGRGTITHGNGKGEYFVLIGEDGFANLGAEWFGQDEIELVEQGT